MWALTNGRDICMYVSKYEHTVCQQIALKFVYMFTQVFLVFGANFVSMHNVLLVVVVVSKPIHK
jgi:hypothetical protein